MLQSVSSAFDSSKEFWLGLFYTLPLMRPYLLPGHKSLAISIFNYNQTKSDAFARLLFLLLVLNSGPVSTFWVLISQACATRADFLCTSLQEWDSGGKRSSPSHERLLTSISHSFPRNQCNQGLHYNFTRFWVLPNQCHRVSAHSGIISVTCYIHENCCFMYQNFILLCYWTVFYCVTISIILYTSSW